MERTWIHHPSGELKMLKVCCCAGTAGISFWSSLSQAQCTRMWVTMGAWHTAWRTSQAGALACGLPLDHVRMAHCALLNDSCTKRNMPQYWQTGSWSMSCFLDALFTLFLSGKDGTDVSVCIRRSIQRPRPGSPGHNWNLCCGCSNTDAYGLWCALMWYLFL